MKKEPHGGLLSVSLLSSLRVVRGLSVKLVRVDQKGHVGAWGLRGLKERKATLD